MALVYMLLQLFNCFILNALALLQLLLLYSHGGSCGYSTEWSE